MVMRSDKSSVEALRKCGYLTLRMESDGRRRGLEGYGMEGTDICHIDLLDGWDDDVGVEKGGDGGVTAPREYFALEVGMTGHGQKQSFRVNLRQRPVFGTTRMSTELSKRLEDLREVAGLQITVKELEDWKRLKMLLDVPALHVKYASQMADIINTPYASDLDRWLKTKSEHDDISKKMHERLNKTRLDKDAKKQARCTIRACVECNDLSSAPSFTTRTALLDQGMLPSSSSFKVPKTNECAICKGLGGRDGGLFSGICTYMTSVCVHMPFELAVCGCA